MAARYAPQDCALQSPSLGCLAQLALTCLRIYKITLYLCCWEGMYTGCVSITSALLNHKAMFNTVVKAGSEFQTQ